MFIGLLFHLLPNGIQMAVDLCPTCQYLDLQLDGADFQVGHKGIDARIKEPEKEETQKQERTQEMPEFSVTVTPYEREGSNIKGLARIYFENSFIVNNINIVQGKEKIFVSMPSYKTKQVDEQGKPIYQDVCYPVTKDFREKLYNEIISEYEKAKDKSNEKARESAEKHHGNPDKEKDKEATPFR